MEPISTKDLEVWMRIRQEERAKLHKPYWSMERKDRIAFERACEQRYQKDKERRVPHTADDCGDPTDP